MVKVGLLVMIMALLAPNGAEADEAALPINTSVAVALEEPGETRLFAVDARPEAYVKGMLSVDRGRVDFELIDASGKPLRRFADDAGGTSEFQFVAPTQEVRLRITARSPATLKVTLSTIVSIEDQKTPAQTYLSPRIAQLSASVKSGGTTDKFWVAITDRGTPLVEDGPDGQKVVTFLGRGAKRNIRLFGAPSNDHESLDRLGNTDVWFKSFLVPADTRLSYQLAFDVPDLPGTDRDRRVAILSTAAADPLNRFPWPKDASDRFNQESTVDLPGAPAQPWVEDQGKPKGNLSTFRIKSALLGNERDITLYTPPDYEPSDPDVVLLFVFDAKEYLSKVPTPIILDNMIARNVIPAVVAVFVSNPDRQARATELPDNPAFADFLAQELLPDVLSRARLKPTAQRTVLAGSSYGGLASATVALRHPEVFGNVLSLSGSFWWSSPGIDRDKVEQVAWKIANTAPKNIRFFIGAGLFETRGSPGVGGILETNRHLRDVMLAKGYSVTLKEYAGGHDYLVWRGAMSDGLIALFGR